MEPSWAGAGQGHGAGLRPALMCPGRLSWPRGSWTRVSPRTDLFCHFDLSFLYLVRVRVARREDPVGGGGGGAASPRPSEVGRVCLSRKGGAAAPPDAVRLGKQVCFSALSLGPGGTRGLE